MVRVVENTGADGLTVLAPVDSVAPAGPMGWRSIGGVETIAFDED